MRGTGEAEDIQVVSSCDFVGSFLAEKTFAIAEASLAESNAGCILGLFSRSKPAAVSGRVLIAA
jgi:hypothetical protein